MDYTHHYDSPLGGITLASDGAALIGLWFDGQKYCADAPDQASEEEPLPVFEETSRWLDIYFSGKAPDFRPKLSMRTTPFRKMVWEIMLTIPFGRTMTYGQIADTVGAADEPSPDVRSGCGRRGGTQFHFAHHPMPSGHRRQRQPGRLCRRH